MQEAAGTQLPASAVGEGEEKEAIRCPRCDSSNTKFCYYNNYNLSQPRHFCKDCRRYWTKGGSLRNVPVGGGTRKNCKRAASAAAAAGTPKRRLSSEPPNTASSVPILPSKPEPTSFFYQGVESEDKILDIGESFSSLLTSGETFRSMLDTFGGGGGGFGGFPAVAGESIRTTVQSSNDSGGSSENLPTLQLENLMGLQGDCSPWGGGWPDHAIYTPGSGFR